jgi:hypothetical protein
LATPDSLPVEVFVSPDGLDEAPGSRQQPFRTLQRALHWLAGRRKEAEPDGAARDLTITVEAGRYPLDASLVIGAEHSGSANSRTILRGTGRCLFTGAREWPPVEPADEVCRSLPGVSAFQLPSAQPWLSEVGDFGFKRAIPPAPAFALSEGKALGGGRFPREGWLVATEHRFDAAPEALALRFDPALLHPLRDEPAVSVELIWSQDWNWQIGRAIGLDFDAGRIEVAVPALAAPSATGPVRAAFRNLRGDLMRQGSSWLDPRNSQLVFHSRPGAKVELCALPGHLMRLIGARHVIIEGLDFEGGLDWAIAVSESFDVEIRRCSARNLAAGGFLLQGSEFHVRDCAISGVGTTGIRLDAGNCSLLSPGESRVEDCRFTAWGGRKPIYEPAVRLLGVGSVVRNCSFSDAPHLAIECAGNDHLIEGCEFRSVVTYVDDMGAVYLNNGEDPLQRGHRVSRNLFRDIGSVRAVASAVYLDRASSGVTVSENLFFRIKGDRGSIVRAVHCNAGDDVLIERNLFVDCDTAIEIDFYLLSWGAYDLPAMRAGRSRALEKLGAGAPHAERYAALSRLTPEPISPSSINVRRNRMILSPKARGVVVVNDEASSVVLTGNEVLTKNANPPLAAMPGFSFLKAESCADLVRLIEAIGDWSTRLFGHDKT